MYRILHVIDSLGCGGAEHQLFLNIEALDPRLFENFVCSVREDGYSADVSNKLAVPVHWLGAAGKHQWPKAALRLRNLVRDLRIDLIHTSLFSADIIGGIVGRLCGIPVVGTVCNIGGEPERLVDNPYMNRLKLAVTTKLWGLALRTCHLRSIAISNAVKHSAVRTYGLSESKVTLIYRALSESWFTESHSKGLENLRRSLSLDGAYPILLNVGRLVPQKGQSYLIQAMPEVLKEFPRARLLIAGEGSLRDSLASTSLELGVDGRVTLLGRRNDIQDLLTISDIFVFPSNFEGLGVSLLEAAAMGKPCVASRVGPLPEVLEDGETGILVPPQSPAMLAEAIVHLAKNREIAQAMGRRGRQTLLEKFTIDRTIKQLEQVYVQVLHAAGRTRRQEPDRCDLNVTGRH